MMKRLTLEIADIYVPVKRRAALEPTKAQEIAESILQVGQQTPILVRQDGDTLRPDRRSASFGSVQATGRKTSQPVDALPEVASRASRKPPPFGLPLVPCPVSIGVGTRDKVGNRISPRFDPRRGGRPQGACWLNHPVPLAARSLEGRRKPP
jgi:hypothetical protein